MAAIVLGVIIGSYALFVIYRKVKDMRNGNFCSCGCNNCPSKKQCVDKK